jgi:hypothetical protein
MIHNQKMLSNLILTNPKNKSQILVPIMMTKENELKVYIEEEKKWKNMLFIKSKKDPVRLNFNKYFVSLVHFLSDLCYQRNYIAIEVLRLYYPLDLCLTIITNDSYQYDIRDAFCALT